MLGINSGFTSIMVDRSSLSYEENVEQTKEVVKMCKPLGISVEAVSYTHLMLFVTIVK